MNELLNKAIEDIKECDFVAIDFEFSGLFVNKFSKQKLFEYFQSCVEGASSFLIVQMGICTAKQSVEIPEDWQLSPYNFYVLPTYSRTLFSFDTKTFQWLKNYKFDFNKWVENGYNLMRLDELQALVAHTHTLGDVKYELEIQQNGLQILIEQIIENEKPLVVHNGHLDILHLYDKFISDIPTHLNTFCKDWLRLFTGGTYDTRHIASEGKYTVIGFGDNKTLSLNMLREFLLRKSHRSNFTILSENSSCSYSLKPSTHSEEAYIHEAGFDALITAQIFILELELYINPPSNLSKRRRKELNIANTVTHPGPWITTKTAQKFKNYISLANISPGYINMDACAKTDNII